MNPTKLRRLAKKYGTPGVLFAGAVLLLHSLWRRKPLLIVSFGVLVLAAGLRIPMTCSHRAQTFAEPFATYFDPQMEAQDMSTAEGPLEEPTAFRVVDLGVLPGGEISEATGISDKGHVAGVSDVSGETFHGFFWDGGKMHDIGTLGGELSIALGVNNSGQVVGVGDDRQGMPRGFVWQNGKMRDVGHLGGGITLASSINNRGGVVGLSATRDYLGHAFVWQDGKMRDIGTPKGCDLSIAQDINDSGIVVGFALNTQGNRDVLSKMTEAFQSYFKDGLVEFGYSNSPKMFVSSVLALSLESDSARAFAWNNGKFTELRGKREDTIAIAINNKGKIVGADISEREESVRAMLWESEQGKELPLPSGFSDSFAIDISDSGIIVGGAFSEEDITACAWKDGKAHDLNKLLPSGSGWTLYFASSINAKGQIVGIGEHNGQLHAFLLDPKG
jgi:probable HAF family extracellular repeat protein